jgi:hypothetical protein
MTPLHFSNEATPLKESQYPRWVVASFAQKTPLGAWNDATL